MIHDLSTPEIVECIASGKYYESDIVKYCDGVRNIKDLLCALIVRREKMIERKPIVSFAKDAIINDAPAMSLNEEGAITITPNYCDELSEDDKRKLWRIENAISIIESMSVKQEQEPQRGKEKAIERYIIGNNKEATIQAIKSLVSGKKGKQPAAVIFVAVSDGYMSKPTFDILKSAFGIVGTKSAFNTAYSKYNDNGVATKTHANEINAVRASLKRVLEGAS